MTLVSPSKVERAPISQTQWGTYSGYSSVVGHFGNVNLTPSPVACPEQSRRAPATGCFCRPSTRRLVLSEAEGRVPAYRRQAAGLSGKGNVVKLTHYLLVHMIGDTFRKKRRFRHPRNLCRRGELGGYCYCKARPAVRREERTLRRRQKNRSRKVQGCAAGPHAEPGNSKTAALAPEWSWQAGTHLPVLFPSRLSKDSLPAPRISRKTATIR